MVQSNVRGMLIAVVLCSGILGGQGAVMAWSLSGAVKSVGKGVVNAGKGAVKAGVHVAKVGTDEIKAHFDDAKGVVSNVLGAANGIKGVVNGVKGVVNDAAGVVNGVKGVVNDAAGVANGVKGVVNGVVQDATSVISSIDAQVAHQACTDFLGMALNTGGNQVDSFINSAFSWKADIEKKVGEYSAAASTLADFNSWKSTTDNVKKILEVKGLGQMQSELVKATTTLHQEKDGLLKDLNKLIQEKSQKISEVMALPEARISQEAMQKLQGAIKNLNTTIEQKQSILGKVEDNIKSVIQKYPEVVMNDVQKEALDTAKAAVLDLANQNKEVQEKVQRSLADVSEHAKQTFPGLMDNLTKLSNIETTMRACQTRLITLASNPVATIAEIANLQKEMANMSSIKSACLKELENSFTIAKLFRKMSPEDLGQFMPLFNSLKENAKLIDEAKSKVDSLLKARQIGDMLANMAKTESMLASLKNEIDALAAKPCSIFEKVKLAALSRKYEAMVEEITNNYKNLNKAKDLVHSFIPKFLGADRANSLRNAIQKAMDNQKSILDFKSRIEEILQAHNLRGFPSISSWFTHATRLPFPASSTMAAPASWTMATPASWTVATPASWTVATPASWTVAIPASSALPVAVGTSTTPIPPTSSDSKSADSLDSSL